MTSLKWLYCLSANLMFLLTMSINSANSIVALQSTARVHGLCSGAKLVTILDGWLLGISLTASIALTSAKVPRRFSARGLIFLVMASLIWSSFCQWMWSLQAIPIYGLEPR